MAGPGQPPLERPRALPDALSWRGSAAGDAVSTADDLARLGEALIGNRLLSPAVKNRLFPRQGQFWRIGQSGGNIGTNADLSVLPESGWTLVVLSNFDPPAAETMAEVLRGAATGQGCRPVGANERRSPFGEPPSSPPPGAPSAPGVAWEQSGEARANGWIDAFNSGDAAVLESFAEANYSAAALARRTADERRAVFRDLQAQAGRVTVTSLQAVDGELRVRATDRNGREIAMAFRFEPVAPYRIEGVSVDAGER
jgi:hypothetical protein